MSNINDYRIRITGITLLTLLRFGFFNSEIFAGNQPFQWRTVLVNLLLAFLTSLVTWETNRAVVVYMNRFNINRKLSLRGFTREAVYLLVVNAITYSAFIGVLMIMDIESQPPLIFLFFGLIDRTIYGFAVAGFYELLIFIEALKKSRTETEELKKLNLTIQFESLKNQVKPHFLFNSLNTLTGLVEKDQAKAVKFIAELSTVYRYLLQSNDKELIGLNEELAFTNAYFFLLKMRFGDGISMDVDMPDSNEYLVPPLTLQMLVENAVKHNQVSARIPLKVQVRVEDSQWLAVKNNIQLKRHNVSNGVGLSNIAAKFRLLNQPELQVETTDEYYLIRIPLIKSKHA